MLIERGECSFVSKAIRAQEAGAVAAIITDEVTLFIFSMLVNNIFYRVPVLYLLLKENFNIVGCRK